MLQTIYGTSLSLLTDLYQVTMAYGYWKTGMTDREAVFNLYFRQNPFNGGFTIACGLDHVVDYLQNFRFSTEDLRYLATLTGNDGQPLFDAGFLAFLGDMSFCCDVDAVQEGTVVFPHEPLLRIRGPLYQCQLLETPLLNLLNFQSLIATKAARMRLAAGTDTLLEFGLRRAQGIDGGLAASRAAYIGGCDATSNLLAGKLFDIPVKGTHAHSWVMSFSSEQEAFDQYGRAMPNNAIFLVDTYHSLDGVRKAVQTGRALQDQGYRLAGIRLDSGDLAYLSIEARKILDEAGFHDTAIVASNDLDEYLIANLKNQQEATINVWGVGTRLATAYDQPALGGVYKMTALRTEQGQWEDKIKISEQTVKVSNPGIQQVRRFYQQGEAMADMIYDERTPMDQQVTILDPMDATRRKTVAQNQAFRDLLTPVFRQGQLVAKRPPIEEIRQHVQAELQTIHRSIKRFHNPHSYPVGLEQRLYERKQQLILDIRQGKMK